VVATGLALVLGTLSALPPPAQAATSEEQRLASELVSFVNRERAARGLPGLAVEPYAAGVAQEWAERQRAAGGLSHRPDLSARYSSYPAVGENVGTTTEGTGVLHRDFMASSGHRRNILQPGFDALGVGVACSRDGRMWVAVDFVARSQSTADRYSSKTPSSSPVAVGDGGSPCPRATATAATVGSPGTGGYWMVARDGGIFAFGDVGFLGSMGGQALYRPIIGMAATPRRDGYWMVAADGGVFNFGNAAFKGSMGGKPLYRPVVGIAARPQGDGYWMAASDGGVFNYGGAPFHGAMGGRPLNRPVVGVTATPSGNGYWLVASDGGIFNYGDAPFLGSMGGRPLNQPIVGMAATGSGRGYWLVARDGGIFAFGDAPFHGSMGGQPLNQPIVGMMRTPSGNGYWLVAADGGIFNYGDAKFRGSTGAIALNQPVVGGAA
jgi:hypothetical protein